MDRRSWPWRKKSSEKTASTTDTVAGSSSGMNGARESQDNAKHLVNNVQLSQERYTCLLEMEEQVKLLNEQLSTAQSELTNKEKLIKQHTKVAEEAVSGWEKAEAEAMALKNQLESVTLLKLTAEDRVAHLDGALKECMKEIRNVKEESEKKLQDVVFAKTKQWEEIKFDLETQMNVFEQELLRATAENDALSRSLEERSHMLLKISEEKAQADADIEILKTNIQSCERELTSMKYEVHIVSKELEIRNEEKNMCVRSADAASKQHLEDVKKITKLEAECQRLRGLVRKKLPGPAALAQMKHEVESSGRDYGDARLRRSPAKSTSPHVMPAPDFSLESIHQCQKENEFLTARLLTMEEETKMLKEALSKRNSELQASRNMFAKSASKLRMLESQMLVLNQQKSPSRAANLDISVEGPSIPNESNPPSLTSMSEDGNDEEVSCSESWATALMSELSHFKKDKDIDKTSKAGSSTHIELMDDFLEMEKLACLSAESNEPVSAMDGVVGNRTEGSDGTPLADGSGTKNASPQRGVQNNLQSSMKMESPTRGLSTPKTTFDENGVPLSKLQAKIALLFESETKDTTMENLLEKIKHLVHEMEEKLPQHPVSCIYEDVHSVDTPSTPKSCQEKMDKPSCVKGKYDLREDLQGAISQIHDSILLLFGSLNSEGIVQKVLGEFTLVVNKVLAGELCLDELIVALSSVLSESGGLGHQIFGVKDNEKEHNSLDCIDKVTLLEKKIAQHESVKERLSDSPMDTEILQGRSGPDYEVKGVLARYSVEEFEQLKLEKDNLEIELANCTGSLEQTRIQLLETEKHLADIKLELTTSQKSNTLAETQLKCMAESYRSLESRFHELETEIKTLQSKTETLETELQEERCAHQEHLAKYNDLQEQLERYVNPPEVETEEKIKQDLEIAAAAEKLAECQETIFLLGRQLKSLHPNERDRINFDIPEALPSTSASNPQGWPTTQPTGHTEMDNVSSTFRRTGDELPLEGYGQHSSSETEAVLAPKSPINSRLERPRTSKSSSSSTEEKHGRGFSRFFSKGKNGQ